MPGTEERIFGIDLTPDAWPGIEHRIGPFGTFDSHGGVYLTLTSGGIKDEGAPLPVKCEDDIAAWGLYRSTLRTYLIDGKAKTVEWRVLPTTERSSDEGKYWVRSRLSIVELYS